MASCSLPVARGACPPAQLLLASLIRLLPLPVSPLAQKRDTVRTAAAAARVVLGPAVFSLVAANQIGKGDVLTVAQLAGEWWWWCE